MSDLDDKALRVWLARTLSNFDGIVSFEKFAGGQSNPTYRVSLSTGAYVLRRKPFGPLLPSAHAIEREFRLLYALHPLGFPVPRPIALCEDQEVIGAAFYLMEMIEGRTYWNGSLSEVPRTERKAYYEAMIDTLAQLHSIDVGTAGLTDFGRPGNYFARQVERWTKQYRAAQTEHIPEMEKLIDWLPKTIPQQSRSSIIHGDYRIDNLIYAPQTPSVCAVLDWELATIGDPLADFAYLAMNWIMPVDGRAGLSGLDLEAEGIPSLDEVVARYCAATGRDTLPDLNWYFAYNLFRLAGIVQGIKRRVLDGNASSAQAEAMAAKVIPLASAAWAEALRAGAGN
ncbi:phosphotransferase family protein [Sphingobium sp. EP60837]|uniref:phosphotransferase family protein n=1 Tax=Sphingobium sp. EP60837 TaxID=1855519 RepID=UPI0007DD8C52|nr:phosphotransferase family protein [Sphingobium sp. EP60837]ANI79257.1 Kanamycin kinase [Sphingobium sp. EP60837]